jgi:hypothetical protein
MPFAMPNGKPKEAIFCACRDLQLPLDGFLPLGLRHVNFLASTSTGEGFDAVDIRRRASRRYGGQGSGQDRRQHGRNVGRQVNKLSR